ncbi:aminodeoxychorismate lyase [Zobellella iuensis]|uniref:Aminodeoxychorismate lyase n=1 Tax=Zobellella iuensis TaxID=2803811 RepID=A0ABS1QT07_9GAMM|nr:aminodeoxychorismate lyase [Zobellella iuensis]MBL1377253.1 aminodeoxychorismate lyase [Zobellella iuensis]
MQNIITSGEPLAALARGWQLGDGHFSTLHAQAGRLRHWRYHQARLRDACRRLRMPEPDWPRLQQDALAVLDGSDQVLRISLLRGPGARGYGIDGCGEPTLVLNTAPFPVHYYDWRERGLAIGLCHGRLGSSPLLAGLKTVNRLEQVLLKAELEQRGLAEGLVLDGAEVVREAVTANLFWREGSRIYTPDLSHGGVCGTVRAWSQDYLGGRLAMVSDGLPRLLAADEIWLTNALMGVVPVTLVEEQWKSSSFSTARELQRAYEQTD